MLNFKAITGLLAILIFLQPVLTFDFTTCCQKAKFEHAFIAPDPSNPVPPIDNQTCAQVYSVGEQPAQPLYVNYTYCTAQCGGMGLSQARMPNQWAAPLVQFILPSVIFSMTIPRRKKIEFDFIFGGYISHALGVR
jgi:hypothetical protein